MTTFRIIYRIISTGQWMAETLRTDSSKSAKLAIVDIHGDEEIKIISVTAI